MSRTHCELYQYFFNVNKITMYCYKIYKKHLTWLYDKTHNELTNSPFLNVILLGNISSFVSNHSPDSVNFTLDGNCK